MHGRIVAFASNAGEYLPQGLEPALKPVLITIEEFSASLKLLDPELVAMAADYPSTAVLL